MKLECNQSSLEAAVSAAVVAIETRTVTSSLANFLLEAQVDQLVVTGGGYECTVKAAITDADIKRQGTFVVPGRAFTDLVKSIASGKIIELEINPQGSRLQVRAYPFRASLAGPPVSSFHISEWAPEYSIQIDSTLFSRGVSGVMSSVASEKTGKVLPFLRGVELFFQDNVLTLTSTDGFRVGIARIGAIGSADLKLIVPTSTLTLISGKAESEPILIGQRERKAFFKTGGIEIQSALFDGVFPEVLDRLPTLQSESTFEVGSFDLISALNQVISVIRGLGNKVLISLEPDGMKIEAESNYGEAEAKVDGILTGQPIMKPLSGPYFLEGVRSAGSTSISVGMSTTERDPIIIRPLDGFDFTHFLMPMAS